MTSPKRTVFPVPLELVQRILDQLGYELVFHDHTTARLHFKRTKNVSGVLQKTLTTSKNPPEWVTVGKPDFQCDGHTIPVYDRDYVVDLINKINGQIGGDGERVCLVLIG